MAAPTVIPVVDEGMGNSAYLVNLGDGRGLVVDAARDLRAVRAAADRAGLRIAYAADTHLHADFLSGAVQLAATDDAQVLASEAGAREFPHTGLADGDEVDLGGLRLRALATPGHTREHVSFLLLDSGGAGEVPLGVFTGGSLLVGSAARTDLAGADHTQELARAQYASLTRLLTLPDATAVWPTHGAGSFCSAPPGTDRVTTIGRERTTNPLLTRTSPTDPISTDPGGIVDQDTFVARLLAGLGSYPAYFARLGEANRRGPAPITEPVRLPALDVAAFTAEMAAGAQVIDVRPATAFATGHIPRALSITLRPVFATWLGWLADPDRPILVVRDADQDPAEVAWQAVKIAYGNLVGELAGGIQAWGAAGNPSSAIPLLAAGEVGDRPLLDIRQDGEYAAGHIPGAAHLELGHLSDPRAGQRLPAGPLVTMCGHGERAMTAASLLARAGRMDLAVLDGGPDDWSATTGTPLTVGTGR
jgi:glyoxylase-like metal-dependent hydrolase (beta-lactamase superfamily II)/rhodanese-related sulfurtransferase